MSIDVGNLNLLQVPDFLPSGKNLSKDDRSGSASSITSRNSTNHEIPSWVSDVLLSEMVLIESIGENCDSEELDDPPLPDLAKFTRAIDFKNPFL